MKLREKVIEIAARRVNTAFAQRVAFAQIVAALASEAFAQQWPEGQDTDAIRKAWHILQGSPNELGKLHEEWTYANGPAFGAVRITLRAKVETYERTEEAIGQGEDIDPAQAFEEAYVQMQAGMRRATTEVEIPTPVTTKLMKNRW